MTPHAVRPAGDPGREAAPVDGYFVDTLVGEDDALVAARESGRSTTMPRAEVAPNQGKLLAGMVGAGRVLEFGTLDGPRSR
ncbi:hypothetical protein [Micromonospora fluostatini]|uniref:hypothetical protein n=1 Tax=Micromonospora sp. JCM 30529 TaxID=3421643 RepID=UPI003D17A6DA